MALAVAGPSAILRLRFAAGDDRHGPGLAQAGSQIVGVVGLVGDEVADLPAGEERRGDGHVRDVAGGEDQGAGPTEGVGERVDLGRLAAARWADGLRTPPFPPKAERWALTKVD